MTQVPLCQCCGVRPVTGVRVFDNERLALVCGAPCSAPLQWTTRNAQTTLGFLVDRTVIPLLKPHAGLLHQYIAYKGCRDIARVLPFFDVIHFWNELGAHQPLMTIQRFRAGLIWPDMPLANSRPQLVRISTEEATDLRLFLERVLTRETMDVFSDANGEYVSSVPLDVDVPYLREPDAKLFLAEPSPSWSLTFGAALTLPDLFPKSVYGRNAATLHLHPAMQILHAMRSQSTEPSDAFVVRMRTLFTYLLQRLAREGDAFVLGIMVHMISDSFSAAHMDRVPELPCRIRRVHSLDNDEDSVGHASHEGESAVFEDMVHETYTPLYAYRMPAVIHAVAFIFWRVAGLFIQNPRLIQLSEWSVPQTWHTHPAVPADPNLVFHAESSEAREQHIQKTIDYLFYAYVAMETPQ